MSRHRVLCIQRSNRDSIHDRIESIGGLNRDGTRWRITKERAIEGIESGRWQFYVQIEDTISEVMISENQGFKYLKSTNNDTEIDNLLNLPECS